MAIALSVIYTVIDDSGDRGTTEIRVPSGFSLAQYGEFGAAMATLVDAMLSGKVEGADLCIAVDITGLVGNVVNPGADTKELAAFQFLTTEQRPVYLNVPTLDEVKVEFNSDNLNLGDGAVSALMAAMEDGISVTGGTISPCDVAEDDIVTTVYARERFRASGTRS